MSWGDDRDRRRAAGPARIDLGQRQFERVAGDAGLERRRT
jgi:hypothetical protein